MAALTGKSLVIIGGTTGLGLSAARAFVEAGARLVAVGRNAASCEAARESPGLVAAAVRTRAAGRPETCALMAHRRVALVHWFH